jgi:cyclophilin family peptidyl-prolyl cis-trans isomerase/HEAT repeat protein
VNFRAWVLTSTIAASSVIAQAPHPFRPQATAVSQQELQRREQQASGVPWDVLSAEKQWADADVLIPLLGSADSGVRLYALQAVGRLEDPRLVSTLLALRRSAPAGALANAIAQSLKGFDPQSDSGPVVAASNWMHAVGMDGSRQLAYQVITPIGRIVYAAPDQVRAAEEVLVRVLKETGDDHQQAGTYAAAMRSLESLARLNSRVITLDDQTTELLVHSLNKTRLNDDDPDIGPAVRMYAFGALVASRGLQADVEKVGLADNAWEVRRLAVAVLAGAGGALEDAERIARAQEAMNDPSGLVRYEALRAYIRRGVQSNGCQPILDRLDDPDSHVALAALDALGDACRTDEDITTRVLAEARTPQSVAWHREAHAFVALAKRAPEKAAMSMEAFVTHPVWWVRKYAVLAAVATNDLVHLEKLAYDSDDNVRDAAIGPLRKLKKADAEPAIIAALDRMDVQLLRTAAGLLKQSPRNERLFRPLMTALERLTKEGKETSRDARLPLLDAIAAHAAPNDWTELRPLLRDFDPKVAAKAADVIAQLAGKAVVPDPVRVPRGWPAEFRLTQDHCVTVSLAAGPSFRMTMDWPAAPMTVDRFLKLAVKDHYYDGLLLHRVVPNFVVQGGGPGANEYSGHKDYMRDEISASSTNTRGSVGLSTRGRNTADAQFFINLVDNARLDYDYTIFGHVRALDMPVIDAIEEGAQIRSIVLRCSR